MIGTLGRPDGSLDIVESVVNRYSGELEFIDVLSSINSKRDAVLNAPSVSNPNYASTISITKLLDYVNKYYPDILPIDVLEHYAYTEIPQGTLGESALYSRKENADSFYEKRNRLQQEEFKARGR